MATLSFTFMLDASEFDADRLYLDDNIAVFISSQLEKYLTNLGWSKFKISDECSNQLNSFRERELNLIGTHTVANEIICHYTDRYDPWGGSITICEEKLVDFFGTIPSHLYITRTD